MAKDLVNALRDLKEKEAFKIAKDRLDGGYILNGDAGILDETKPRNVKLCLVLPKSMEYIGNR